MAGQRRYATLLAKGEDRRARILAVAQRMIARNGARGTTLGQIAQEAGVSPAGLLHHFDSKEQLLNAVLDARDADDLAAADLRGDTIERINAVAERFERSPELIGMFTVLLAENLNPDTPLHERFLNRYHLSVDIIAKGIRRGQREGRYRPDIDPAVKAAEIVAFITGLETSWLLDPSIPLAEVFREYTTTLAVRLALSPGKSSPGKSSPGKSSPGKTSPVKSSPVKSSPGSRPSSTGPEESVRSGSSSGPA